MRVETEIRRRPAAGAPMVLAVFSYRYDAHLVPDLLRNLAPAVHGWVALDDRDADRALTEEPARRAALLSAAREMGADWILAADPDERFEDALAERIGDLVGGHGPIAWTFRCREMFAPDAYRIDGIWRTKRMVRLFPLPEGPVAGPALHGAWTGGEGPPTRASGLDFHHLRMITPERRRLRRDLYAAADPERRHQRVGYDYLCDERGMRLSRIAPGRGFSPPHDEDGGLWSPKATEIGTPAGDPEHALLALVARHREAGGGDEAASHVAEDLARAAPEDPDLGVLAADLARLAGRSGAAVALAEATAAAFPSLAGPALALSRALEEAGRRDAAETSAERALERLPRSRLLRRQAARTRSAAARHAAPEAPWRRWALGPAHLTEGAGVAEGAELAVVVIALGAPPELAGAVASLVAQDPPPEIVVVNTGGGPARRRLADHLDAIRLIEVRRPCFAGAARNMGVEASAAPVVAFLASDCLAAPGWVRERLARHRAGAAAVASPVVPDRSDSAVALAAAGLLHRQRWPSAEAPARAGRYGLSYERALFETHGLFAPGLRTGEDTEFNRRLPRHVDIDWAPEVLTKHRYPKGLAELARDMAARGERRASHAPFVELASAPDRRGRLREMMRADLRGACAAIDGLADTPRGGRWRAKAAVFWGAWWARKGLERGLDRVAGGSFSGSGEDPAAPEAQHVGALLERAEAAAGKGDEGEALALLRRATALDPGHAEALRRLCEALARAKGPRAAAGAAEAAHMMRPSRAQPLRLMRRYAQAAGDRAGALFAAQRLLVLTPDDPGVHRALAKLHAADGRPEVAARRLAHAERLAR